MSLSVDDIRQCLEGGVPGVIATCSEDGEPNVSLVSQVHRVDRAHIALSFQFFNKTRQNILRHPVAVAQVIDPVTAAKYRLRLRYVRTESSGPLFEHMRAKLAGIASHTGMSGVFVLRGADIYRAESIVRVPGMALPGRLREFNALSAMRRIGEQLVGFTELEAMLDGFLAALHAQMNIGHSMVLLCAGDGRRLFTVATYGYSDSGVGAEIPVGTGVIGVCAQHRTPIGISYPTNDYAYSRAVRDSALAQGVIESLETEIPFPGLPAPHSQLAVPIVSGATLLGVIYVESAQDQRFGYDDEDALVTLAALLGGRIRELAAVEDNEPESSLVQTPVAAPSASPMLVRRYRGDNSVFVDDDYLIKGVAGAILWKLLSAHQQECRAEFTNRELRLDAALRLPDVVDNLEARLILLTKRLAERCPDIGIEKTGRGRFRLRLGRPLRLEELP